MTMPLERISILVPAYNEEQRIGATVRAARLLAPADDCKIIVVDDGSTDRTAQAAEEAGADIVLTQPNRGKGAALQAALTLAQGDVLLLLDADLADTAQEAGKLLAPLLAGEADMTIALFPDHPGRGGGVGAVVRLARWGIRTLTGRTMRAPLSGQRAVRREVLDRCGGFAAGWGVEIALTVRAARAGFSIREVQTEMDHRVTGRSATAMRHRAAQFLAAARILIQLAMERKSSAPV